MAYLLKNTRLFQRLQKVNILVNQYVTEALPLPTADNEIKNYSPKIIEIVKEITKLNLVEVSDLNSLLKKTLNIKDTPFATFAQPPLSQNSAKESEEASQSQKTSFTVKLTQFDESKKIGIIKEIKNIVEGLNLVQAKKFVESLPQVVKADLGKDEAEKLKEHLTKLGATILIE